VEGVDPPARQQPGVLVGRHRLTGVQHRLGQLHLDRGVAELFPGGQVAAAVGVAGHPRDEATLLEQEDAGPLHLAELGELAAGRSEEVVHGLGLGGGLDQTQEDLGLRRPALLRPPGPRLGEGEGELGGRLPELVRARRGGRLDGEDADDLTVHEERLPVGGPDPALGQLLVRGPASVRRRDEGPPVAHDRREERGTVQHDGGAQRGLGGRIAGAGDRLSVGDGHLRRCLVHPYGHAGGAGRGPQSGELGLDRGLRVVGRRRWHQPRRRPLVGPVL
jgi:hypothetical protein